VIHHEIMMKSLFFVWFLCVQAFLVAFLASFGASRPQTQLKWNWEEVILSRNGPSTTTTPRPTWWSTTTLRFLEAAPVVKSGSIGSVEDAYLVPRAKKRPRIYEENFQSAASQKTSGTHSLALTLLLLIPTMLTWN